MDLEQKAIDRIKMASEMSLRYYGKPLICTYSGGKDSDVMLELFMRSGIPFEVHNSHTTVDAPQTVYHIRKKFHDLELKGIKCTIEMPTYCGERITMWTLIPRKKMPPWRRMRYCCSVLKENGCANRMISTGVRWDESAARKDRETFEHIADRKEDKISVPDEIMLMNDNSEKRKILEQCQLKSKTAVNPIIDWKHADIWNSYERAYKRAFQKMLEEIWKTGKQTKWKPGEEVFTWWMEDKNVEGQYSIFDYTEVIPN